MDAAVNHVTHPAQKKCVLRGKRGGRKNESAAPAKSGSRTGQDSDQLMNAKAYMAEASSMSTLPSWFASALMKPSSERGAMFIV